GTTPRGQPDLRLTPSLCGEPRHKAAALDALDIEIGRTSGKAGDDGRTVARPGRVVVIDWRAQSETPYRGTGPASTGKTSRRVPCCLGSFAKAKRPGAMAGAVSFWTVPGYLPVSHYEHVKREVVALKSAICVFCG